MYIYEHFYHSDASLNSKLLSVVHGHGPACQFTSCDVYCK